MRSHLDRDTGVFKDGVDAARRLADDCAQEQFGLTSMSSQADPRTTLPETSEARAKVISPPEPPTSI